MCVAAFLLDACISSLLAELLVVAAELLVVASKLLVVASELLVVAAELLVVADYSSLLTFQHYSARFGC